MALYSPRGGAPKQDDGDLELLRSKFDPRLRSHDGTGRPCGTSVNASLREKDALPFTVIEKVCTPYDRK